MSVETLAQALLEAGILDAPSVEMRVPRARSGLLLLDGIVNDGIVTESSLVNQLARALSVPRYDPKERSPEPDALACLDARSIEELGALPVALRGAGGLLWVAVCDPTDEPLLAEVARRTNRRVKACVIGPRELVRAMQALGQATQQVAVPQAYQANGFRVPMPTAPPPQPMAAGYGAVPLQQPMPLQQPVPLQQPMPLPAQGYAPYGYPAQMQQPMPQMQPVQQPQLQMPQGGFTPGLSQAPAPRGGELQRLEDELSQAKQVVKVLAQMLVERGLLDGEELKRRLRAERDRKG